MIIVECQECKERLIMHNEGAVPICHDRYMKMLGVVKEEAKKAMDGQSNKDWINSLTEKDFLPIKGQDLIDKRVAEVKKELNHFVKVTGFKIPGSVGEKHILVNKKKFELFLDKIAIASAKGGLK